MYLVLILFCIHFKCCIVLLYLLHRSLRIAKRVEVFQLLHFFDILWITEVRSIHFAFSCLLSTTTTLIFYNLFSILNFLIHMKQYISYLSFRCIIFSLPRFCLHFRHIRSHSRCRSRKIILMLSKFQIFSIFKFQLLSILTQKWCSYYTNDQQIGKVHFICIYHLYSIYLIW